MKVNKTPNTAAARQLRGVGRTVTIGARLSCAATAAMFQTAAQPNKAVS
jgi:hypothetical protein